MGFANYFESFDYAQMRRDFPLGSDFTEDFARRSTDHIRAHQERLFLRCVARAAEIPFYQRLWRNAGIDARDIRGLDDLPKLPIFDKSALMQSLTEHPPFGDYHGWERWSPEERPVHGTPEIS